MENDINFENKENLTNSNKYFKLDFYNQNLKGNRKFERFKELKLKELGKDAKLFNCKKDNILFYVNKAECKTLPLFYKKCPLCNDYICYFCGRITHVPVSKEGNCCVKLKIYYLFFYHGFKSLEKELEPLEYILILLPFLNILSLFLAIIVSLYFSLQIKYKNLPDNIDVINQRVYDDILKQYGHHKLIITIFILTYILFAIYFFLWYFCFILILLIICFFTKFYPFKYLYGIIKGALN